MVSLGSHVCSFSRIIKFSQRWLMEKGAKRSEIGWRIKNKLQTNICTSAVSYDHKLFNNNNSEKCGREASYNYVFHLKIDRIFNQQLHLKYQTFEILLFEICRSFYRKSEIV